MIAQSRATATGMLLSFICGMSSAVARGSMSPADPPWNSEHISQLPAEVRNALSDFCDRHTTLQPIPKIPGS